MNVTRPAYRDKEVDGIEAGGGETRSIPDVIELNRIEMDKKEDISKVKYRILGREICDGEE